MDITNIEPDAFFQSVNEVSKQLLDEEAHCELLDRARASAPVIDSVLKHFALLIAAEPQPGRGDALKAVHRDLVVLLAIHRLQQHEGWRGIARLN